MLVAHLEASMLQIFATGKLFVEKEKRASLIFLVYLLYLLWVFMELLDLMHHLDD
uniref:Uncharacterized protein n=1 Tax=Rhizophora mucronata TaxID=61149 RepID=A0A2P2QP95_RHIMU